MSNQEVSQQKEKDKDIYFIILNPIDREEKIDFTKLKYVSNIVPSIIYQNTMEELKLEEIVFKFQRKKKKKQKKEGDTDNNEDKGKNEEDIKLEKEYSIKYFSGVHWFEISFDSKKKSFIYSPNLDEGNIFIDAIPEPIDQEIIPLYKKLNIFEKALENNKEIDKKEKLYENSIDLYEKKKKFSLLIYLFLKLYESNKSLCDKLMKIFFEINDKENNDKEKDLNKDLKSFQYIYSKAEEIISEKKYDPIHFYGVVFSYLHYYDKKNFSGLIKKFSDGNADILYEILIKYSSHFIYPLNQDQKFFDNFIKYVLKKDYKYLIFKRAMKYIEDIETYIFVINQNKNDIFEKYKELKTKPIELGPNLKLVKHKKDIARGNNNPATNEYSDEEDNTPGLNASQAIETECNVIIKLIEDLMKFSKENKILAIYLKVTFWINLIKQYDIPDWENIDKLNNLRELYKKYNDLINILYEKNDKKKKEDIKSEINSYFERDEFASDLNKNIKLFFEISKDKLSNAEILGTIEKYNPYFSIRDKADIEIFKNKRQTYIFDYINFKKITPTFIKNYKHWNFELMFEEIIGDYINKLIGKIEDIQTFGNIINLIEINRIKEEMQREYFKKLKEKYKLVIENDIKNIKSKDQLNNAVSITAEFVSKLFLYEKNTSFIDNKIKKLEYRIKSLIYIELLTKYKGEDYKKLKEYIYDIYLKNLDTKEGRDDIIKLVKKLTGEEKKFFIQEMLLKECVFSKEEFYSNQENYKIKTLYELKKDLEAEQFYKEKEKKDEIGEKGEDNTKKEEEKLLDLIDLNALSERGNDNAKILRNTLDSIRKELENMSLIKKDLEKFLKIKRNKNQIKDKEDLNKISEKENKNINEKIDSVKEEVLIKLELISLVLTNYSSEKKYDEYKLEINNINEKLDKLNETKELLLIFHKNKYKDDINKINDIIERIENNSIIDFKKDVRQKEIKNFEKYNTLCDEIKKVKDFLLFKKIFENATGIDQLERFEDATKKLKSLKYKLDGNEDSTEKSKVSKSEKGKSDENEDKTVKSKDSKSEKGKSDEKKIDIEIIFNEKEFINIFRDIKEELSHKNESESQLFTKQMIDYFDIKNESVKNDLKMLINSKKYENIVKSIKYFFDNFSNKKINLPKNLNLSEYSLENLKITLDELKTNDIYDYNSKSQYYKIFT